MNAAIRAVVRSGLYCGFDLYGIERGFAGLTGETEFRRMEIGSVAGIIHRGGTILRTARAPEFIDPAVQDRAASLLIGEGIESVVVIGGDGSLRGARELESRGIKTAGIPATIDNDIPGTDNAIGFDTAVNTVLDVLNRLRDTAASHERIFVVEVMGRESGFIALAAGMAGGAEVILVPEKPFDLEEVCRRLQRGIARKKTHSIILVAEGAAGAVQIKEEVQNRTGLETRVSILGHMQRGGAPTAADRLIGSRMGAAAVELLLQGNSGVLTGIRGNSICPVSLEEENISGRPFPDDLYEMALILAR